MNIESGTESSGERLRAKIAEGLRSLRDNWKDEIPDHFVSGPGTENYKVEANWWGGVVLSMDGVVEFGFLTGDLAQKCVNFVKKYEGSHFPTAENIAEANALIDEVLAALEGR